MSRNKLTTEEFIEKAKKIHGDKYDYSKVDYKDANTKVIIICPIHGEFKQKPASHLQGTGCPGCSNNIKLTTESFIKRAKKIHGDKYSYSKVDYKSAHTKVTIICPIHGDFEQNSNDHLLGKGCTKCSNKEKIDTKRFIKKSREVHGDKYDYSKVDYKHSKIPVKILCKIHGYYNQMPVNHLQGSGCPKCGSTYRMDVEEFVKKARRVHGDLYNYSNVEYKNSKTPIKIFCKIHGYFSQIPAAHLQGHGCSKCNVGFPVDSKLSLLSNSDVEHLSVHQLIELIGQNLLPADYFFPDHNLVVEIDSDMHDPWYDSARDDYMNVVYGLQVIRLYEFGEPSTEVARIDDFGIALNKLKYSRTFSIDNSDLVLSWFYEKNKDIIDALNIIEANINSSRNGIFDASGYQHLIRNYRTLDRIDEIIKGVYNINVVMEVWNR